MRGKMPDRDPLYLFLCHLEWRNNRRIAAYHELIAALDDHDLTIRKLAEGLLRRVSPHPKNREVHLRESAALSQHCGEQ